MAAQKKKKKDVQIHFRLTEDDAAALRKQVEKSGLTMQNYLERCVKKKKIANTDDIRALMPQIKRIGNNLNQLTRALNGRNYVDYGTIEENQKELSKLWQSLKHALQELV